jgi:hypothetical protein
MVMIDIVRASFNFDAPAPPEDYLIDYARRIFEEMDTAVEEYLPFDDYSLYLSVEEGSIKGLGKVALYASALYAGIAQYGSFIQGVEIIKRQGCAVAQAIVDVASKDQAVEQVFKKRTRADAGAASRLKRLFVKVRDREIGPEEATLKALEILDPTGTELPPESQREIAISMESLEKHPEQLTLELGISEEFDRPSFPSPRPKRPMPIHQHLLVVIERKRKRDEPELRKKYL